MKITLRQEEVEIAILNYIRESGIELEDSDAHISFTSGRGDNGITSEIEFNLNRKGKTNDFSNTKKHNEPIVQEETNSSKQTKENTSHSTGGRTTSGTGKQFSEEKEDEGISAQETSTSETEKKTPPWDEDKSSESLFN